MPLRIDQQCNFGISCNSSTSSNKESTMKKLITAVILTAILLLNLTGCNNTPAEEPQEEQEQAEPAQTEANTETADWNLYENEAYKVAYPPDWKTKEWETSVGFAPQDMFEDVLWGINVFEQGEKTVEEIIANMGKQFETGRSETIENLEVNGLPAIKAIVTTTKYENWEYEQVIIETEDKIYTLSNGAIIDEKFETFYNSFELL